MNKPEKVSWLKYYSAEPLLERADIIHTALEKTWIRLKGGWYCEYCHKVHCRRVYKYKLHFSTNGEVYTADIGTLRDISEEPGRFVCSLGRDVALTKAWKPDCITAGDKLMTSLEQLGNVLKGR